MANDAVYAAITDQLLAEMDKGVAPWRREWTISGGERHRNATSNRPYSGINPFILDMVAGVNGYSDPRWITFKQAAKLGGKVKRGEKGTAVSHVNRGERLDTENLDENGKPKLIIWSSYGYHRLFNVEQVENHGLSELVAPTDTFSPRDEAEKILSGYKDGPGVSFGGDRAFYSPRTDNVRLPLRGSFETEDAYYSTHFHENIHSTGHPSRLSRFDLDATLPRFGSEDYSFEELIAEFGAAFLCGKSGISNTIPQSASYIDNWASVLRKDRKMLIRAASRAQAAADHILGGE